MNLRSQWLNDFVKWFFDASPYSIDEPLIRRAVPDAPRRGALRTAGGDHRPEPESMLGTRRTSKRGQLS